MCVNMGIKPHVHYQLGYPCQEIADLFEEEVGDDSSPFLQMLKYIANYQPSLKEADVIESGSHCR